MKGTRGSKQAGGWGKQKTENRKHREGARRRPRHTTSLRGGATGSGSELESRRRRAPWKHGTMSLLQRTVKWKRAACASGHTLAVEDWAMGSASRAIRARLIWAETKPVADWRDCMRDCKKIRVVASVNARQPNEPFASHRNRIWEWPQRGLRGGRTHSSFLWW